MTWFSEHLLNHVHWIWVRLSEDAPSDPLHRHLTLIFDIGVRDTINWRLDNQWTDHQHPTGCFFCGYNVWVHTRDAPCVAPNSKVTGTWSGINSKLVVWTPHALRPWSSDHMQQNTTISDQFRNCPPNPHKGVFSAIIHVWEIYKSLRQRKTFLSRSAPSSLILVALTTSTNPFSTPFGRKSQTHHPLIIHECSCDPTGVIRSLWPIRLPLCQQHWYGKTCRQAVWWSPGRLQTNIRWPNQIVFHRQLINCPLNPHTGGFSCHTIGVNQANHSCPTPAQWTC